MTAQSQQTVLIVNGPGLADLSGYDDHNTDLSLDSIRENCAALCEALKLSLDFRQTDDEDEMFRWIVQDSQHYDGVVINPVGYSRAEAVTFELYRSATRTIAHLKMPVIEVHLSNIFRRSAEITRPLHEPEGGMGFICGFGKTGYLLAIRAIARKLETTEDGGSVSRPSQSGSAGNEKVYVINGPNLNLLGTRETHIYGDDTLADIEARCRKVGSNCGLEVAFMQSNHEGQIIDWIQEAVGNASAIVINAAAYTHTSVAIHDALLIFPGYKVELHISNPHVRESFRHVSYVATAVDAVVAGLGTCAYDLTISLIAKTLAEKETDPVSLRSM